MNEWLQFALVAGAVMAVIFGVTLLLSRKGPAETRLADVAKDGDSRPELVLGDMTEAFGRYGSAGAVRDKSEILPELRRAGFYRTTALTEYRAVRMVLVLTPLIAAAAVAQFVEPRRMPLVAFIGAIAAALGFSLPRVYIALKARGRAREIERGLPVFADMLSIALTAGQGLLAGVSRVAEQLRGTFPVLSQELDLVLKQTELMSLNLAFEQWAERSQIPEVRNLSIILNQSQRTGTDVTQVLMEYATNLRATQRQRADAQAQRAGFWMMFPTILCLWVPAAILLVGPMFFEFAERRNKTKEVLQQSGGAGAIKRFNDAQKARKNPPTTTTPADDQ